MQNDEIQQVQADEKTEQTTEDVESTPEVVETDWKAEALKYKSILERQKKKSQQVLSTPEKPKLDDEIIQKVNRLDEIERKRQFGYKNNLSPEETDLLFKLSGDKEPNETLNDPDFKDILDLRRKRTRLANAIPSSSNRSRTVEGKSFKEMTAEERASNWDKIMKRE